MRKNQNSARKSSGRPGSRPSGSHRRENGGGFAGPSSVESYQLPSAAVTIEEKLIVAALKRCGGDGVPSRSLQRESGVTSKDAFYHALHSLEENGEVKVDKDHWVKRCPPSREIWLCPAWPGRRYLYSRPRPERRFCRGYGAALRPAETRPGS